MKATGLTLDPKPLEKSPHKMDSESPVDVIIIRKQSAFERHQSTTQKHLDSHAALIAVLQNLESHLEASSLSFRTLTIEDLSNSVYCFFKNQPESKGEASGSSESLTRSQTQSLIQSDSKPGRFLRPQKNLVIALGGDGTLLHASHYVGGHVRLLGINAFPKSSVGHLCIARESEFKEHLDRVLGGTMRVKKLSRIEVLAPNSQSGRFTPSALPLALNDVLFCNVHPAASSRYTLTLCQNESDQVASEDHVSSGIWISTAAGSTAAISSYGLQRLPLESTRMLLAVREPYFRPEKFCTLTRASLEGTSQSVKLKSHMSRALVAVDGSDFTLELEKESEIVLKLSTKNELRLCI